MKKKIREKIQGSQNRHGEGGRGQVSKMTSYRDWNQNYDFNTLISVLKDLLFFFSLASGQDVRNSIFLLLTI